MNLNSTKKTTRLRRLLLDDPEVTLMPFGALPLHAQMAERAGFGAFEVSGAMAAYWLHGVADVGWVTQTEVIRDAAAVARSVDIPVYCDADAGYGSPLTMWRTVQDFIRAGVAGIHIEDQEEPKKAGGQPGIRLVSDLEAVGRLNAAVDARKSLDPDFVIVARTDAIGAEGGSLEEAIRRGNLYLRETGADAVFYEGVRTWQDAKRALAETHGPAYVLASRHAGATPSVAELTAMGQIMNIVPFILPGVQDVWDLLMAVKNSNELAPVDEFMARVFSRAHDDGFVGWGDVFANMRDDEVRRMEEKYLPPERRRDYENTVHD